VPALALSAEQYCSDSCYGCLPCYCYHVRPIGFEVPGTRLNGIFFSEWKFTNLFFYVGFPVAVLTAAIKYLPLGVAGPDLLGI
jgi:hypothetical protein